MPLQDLTPQLRTRLNRLERTVGIFVTLAALLLLTGFLYYLHHTAQRKGWFTPKVLYQTSLNNAAGLKAGDPVKLMGFNVGVITDVLPNEPDAWYGVTVYFHILAPNFGYIWTDSKVRVAPADFLGNRFIEVLKGKDGAPTVHLSTNGTPAGVLDFDTLKAKLKDLEAGVKTNSPLLTRAEIEREANALLVKSIYENPAFFYTNTALAKPFWVQPLESPALTERLESLITGIETALPGILDLTNKISTLLTNANSAVTRLQGTLAETQTLLVEARPVVSHVTEITDHLRDPNGSLGQWLLPTNLNRQIEATLTNVDSTLQTTHTVLARQDTNLTVILSNLNRTLDHVAGITSNLNQQVQVNSNVLSDISSIITNTDHMVQGLKKHWLLRSAFKTNAPPKPSRPKAGK